MQISHAQMQAVTHSVVLVLAPGSIYIIMIICMYKSSYLISYNNIIVIASVVSVVLVVIAVVAVTIIIWTLVFVRVKRKQAALLQHNYEIPQLPTGKMNNYYPIGIEDKKNLI